jgi:hypothetical protein
MAASMAAVMTVNVTASKVKAHKNSKLMFHGAWTVTEGGAERHKDESELLSKINSDVQSTLVSRYKLSPEEVAEWFKEGREGWLTAEEAKKAGIIVEIIDSDDKIQKISKSASTMLSDRGMKIAAICANEIVEDAPEVKHDDRISQQPQKTVEVPATADTQTVAGENKKDDDADPKNGKGKSDDVIAMHDALMKYQDTNKANEAKIAELIASAHAEKTEFEAEKNKLIAQAREWQAKYDRAVQQEKDMQAANAAKEAQLRADFAKDCSERDSRISGLESRLNKLTLQALELHPDPVVNDWAGAMAACNGDYVQARTKYPLVYSEYMRKQNTKGKK